MEVETGARGRTTKEERGNMITIKVREGKREDTREERKIALTNPTIIMSDMGKRTKSIKRGNKTSSNSIHRSSFLNCPVLMCNLPRLETATPRSL